MPPRGSFANLTPSVSIYGSTRQVVTFSLDFFFWPGDHRARASPWPTPRPGRSLGIASVHADRNADEGGPSGRPRENPPPVGRQPVRPSDACPGTQDLDATGDMFPKDRSPPESLPWSEDPPLARELTTPRHKLAIPSEVRDLRASTRVAHQSWRGLEFIRERSVFSGGRGRSGRERDRQAGSHGLIPRSRRKGAFPRATRRASYSLLAPRPPGAARPCAPPSSPSSSPPATHPCTPTPRATTPSPRYSWPPSWSRGASLPTEWSRA